MSTNSNTTAALAVPVWESSAGPRQTKTVEKAINALRWRGRAVVELHDNGRRQEVVRMFGGEQSPAAIAAERGIFDRFDGEITRTNYREIADAIQAATAALELPEEDHRSSPEELERRAKIREENERRRAEETAEAERRRAAFKPLIPPGAKGVIVAELHEDSSDSLSDYFAHKTTRTVAIGWVFSSRFNFSTVRKAAARFPETAHLGPDAEGDVEHRENYSMGGGNYVKAGYRHSSGWCVRTYNLEYLSRCEPEFLQSLEAETPEESEAGEVCEVQKHFHTKRGRDFWLVVLADKVGRSEFEDIRDRAKAAGGWYSRRWGKTPGGFGFDNQADADAFAAELNGGDKPQRQTAATQRDDLADRLDGWAEKMESEAESLFAPRLENTPKRQQQASSARCKGYNLQNAAKACRALAAGWRAGEVPDKCRGFTTKAAICEATQERHSSGQCGYYQTYSLSGEYHDQSAEAKALREFCGLEGMTPERKLQQELTEKINALKFSKIDGFFPTPDGLAAEVIDRADIREGMEVLEPSAGTGTLADLARDAGGDVTCCERNLSLTEVLSLKGHHVVSGDFVERFRLYDPPEDGIGEIHSSMVQFDRVVMNPPFEKGQDFRHVRHAFQLLKPGGRLVAIMSAGTFQRGGRGETEFREWFDEMGGEREDLPAGSFAGSDAFRQTGVATVLVVIDKPSLAAENAAALAALDDSE